MASGTTTRNRRASAPLHPRLGQSLRALAIAAAVAACGGDGTGPNPIAAAAGTYNLVSFDGRGLPTITFEDAEWRDEVISEVLILEADGTFTNPYSWRYTHKPTGTVEAEEGVGLGTFTRDATELRLRYEGEPNIVVARISGGRITIPTATGAAFLFQKE